MPCRSLKTARNWLSEVSSINAEEAFISLSTPHRTAEQSCAKQQHSRKRKANSPALQSIGCPALRFKYLRRILKVDNIYSFRKRASENRRKGGVAKEPHPNPSQYSLFLKRLRDQRLQIHHFFHVVVHRVDDLSPARLGSSPSQESADGGRSIGSDDGLPQEVMKRNSITS
jgi:hypothetical protein